MELFSRRMFIGSCAAAAAAELPRSVLAAAEETPLLKLGVLSDVHLRASGDEETLRTAFKFFRDRNVDGVVIAGDIADTGRISQLKRCADVWFEVFPDGKYADGRTCEQLFIYGNHCIDSFGWNKASSEEGKLDGIGVDDNRAKAWKDLFHEDYEPVWMKKVNGCAIVGMHWRGWEKESLADFLKRRGGEIDPSKPFVYIQHAHPKNTCIGDWAWGHDQGESTECLSSFPNAVALSGHSHYTLTDERTVWQGAFTSANTSSLKYSSTDYGLRENMPGNSHGYSRNQERRKHVMGNMDTNDGRQGQVITFYRDHMVFERREFVHGNRSLGPDMVYPFPAKNDGKQSFDTRKATRVAPEFAKDAKVSVSIVERDKRKLAKVVFPQALTVDGCRVYDYEVTATLCEEGIRVIKAQRRVMASGYYLPLEMATGENFCEFALDELVSSGHYEFSVRPAECYGLLGAAIASDKVSID